MDEDKKIKILIVDDDSFLLDMYSVKFKENGFDVVGVSSSDAAMSRLRGGFVPDIILLDVIMPKVDGFQFMQMMSDEKIGENSVKIVLSNLGQAADVEKGKKLGASGYIVKASATPSEMKAKVVEIYLAAKK